MLFVCICHLLGYTAKIKIQAFLVLTQGKGSHSNAADSEAHEHTGSCTAPNSSYEEATWATSLPGGHTERQQSNWFYHIHDEKRNSFTVEVH